MVEVFRACASSVCECSRRNPLSATSGDSQFLCSQGLKRCVVQAKLWRHAFRSPGAHTFFTIAHRSFRRSRSVTATPSRQRVACAIVWEFVSVCVRFAARVYVVASRPLGRHMARGELCMSAPWGSASGRCALPRQCTLRCGSSQRPVPTPLALRNHAGCARTSVRLELQPTTATDPERFLNGFPWTSFAMALCPAQAPRSTLRRGSLPLCASRSCARPGRRRTSGCCCLPRLSNAMPLGYSPRRFFAPCFGQHRRQKKRRPSESLHHAGRTHKRTLATDAALLAVGLRRCGNLRTACPLFVPMCLSQVGYRYWGPQFLALSAPSGALSSVAIISG